MKVQQHGDRDADDDEAASAVVVGSGRVEHLRTSGLRSGQQEGVQAIPIRPGRGVAPNARTSSAKAMVAASTRSNIS
jgi:hypothetical protein